MANDNTRCTTNKVRLSYCHLFVPQAPKDPNGKAKYGVTILIPKADADTMNRINAAIQAAIARGIQGRWKGVRPPQPPIPIHDGDGVKQTGEAYGAECRGCYVVAASSELPPKVVDLNLNPILDQTQVYSGCFARVGIQFYPYDNPAKKGIGCSLDAVQKLEDGEPLGGAGPVNPEEIFGAPQPAYAAPGYAQPGYPAPAPQPGYPAPAPQPGYQPAQQATPQAAPAQNYAPAYAPQPAYPQPLYQAPAPTPAPAAPAQQINPITGQPMASGGILGM